MLNPPSIIFIFFTVLFVFISLRLTFYHAKPPKTKIFYTQKGKAESVYIPHSRKRNIWSGICMLLAVVCMFLGIITADPKSVDGEGEKTPSPSVVATITPSPTPSNTPSIKPYNSPADGSQSSVSREKFDWLDELEPLSDMPENFFIGSWSDKSPFQMDDQIIEHGIGMRICGSDYEQMVRKEEALNKTERWDCLEVSLLFALRKNYQSITFSVGVDKGDPSLFGPKEKNGSARVTIEDSKKNRILFDTEWVDYDYANYAKTIDISDVDVLRITFRSGGETRRITKSLRFVIADPKLILKDDAE